YHLQYSLISWVALFINIFATFLAFRAYFSSKSKPLLYLILIDILLIPYCLIHGFLYLVGLEQLQIMIFLFRIQMIILIVTIFVLVLFIESLRTDKPFTIILIVTSIGIGIGFILSIIPESILWDSELGPYLSDFSRIIIGIELLLLTGIVLYQISHFLAYIPTEFFKTAIFFFSGFIVPIVGPVVLITSKLSLVLWGSEILVVATGIFIITLAVAIDNRVLRILPFNVYRISIINMNIGMSIFDVLFETKQEGPADNGLIPHLMTANIQFVQSAIHKTEIIRTIETDNYVFIFRAQKDIVGFVIADRASMLLNSALTEFMKAFYDEFGPNIDSSEISQYSQAEKLIAHYFSFLTSHRIVSITT
ncbi:MAG: hypothetical protein ACXACR_06810, partial [Candidatus Hodarchaeales archaeon]